MTEKQLPTQEDKFLDLNKEPYKPKTGFIKTRQEKSTNDGFVAVSKIIKQTNNDKIFPKKPDIERGKTVQLNEKNNK